MKRIIIALAALILVVVAVVAEATIYSASFNPDDNDSTYEKCLMKIRQVSFKACQKYLQPEEEKGLLLRKTKANQGGMPSLECCANLAVVGKKCTCEAIRRLVIEKQACSPKETGETGKSEMVARAQILPIMCGVKPIFCPILAQAHGSEG